MSETADAAFVVSFKPHTGYDAPLFVIRGNTVGEVHDKIKAVTEGALAATIGEFDALFKGAFQAGAGLGAGPVQHPASQQQPQQAQQAPQQPSQAPQGGYQGQGQGNGYQQPQQGSQGQQQGQPQRGPADPPPGMVAPNCPHGTKRYINGQYGPFWGCPARRDDPSKCKPQKVQQ